MHNFIWRMTVNLVLSGGNFERPGCEIPIPDYFCSGAGSIGWSHLCFSLNRPIGLKFLNHIIQQTEQICQWRKKKLWCVKFKAELGFLKSLKSKLLRCFCVIVLIWGVDSSVFAARRNFPLFRINNEVPSWFG